MYGKHTSDAARQVESGAGDGITVRPYSGGYPEGEEPLSVAARALSGERGYSAQVCIHVYINICIHAYMYT